LLPDIFPKSNISRESVQVTQKTEATDDKPKVDKIAKIIEENNRRRVAEVENKKK